jgi:hypothetical protein
MDVDDLLVDGLLKKAASAVNNSVEHVELVGGLHRLLRHHRRQLWLRAAVAFGVLLLFVAGVGIILRSSGHPSEPAATPALPALAQVGRQETFEISLGTVRALAGSTVQRVPGGAKGSRWAAQVTQSPANASSPAGVRLIPITPPSVGGRYSVSVVVRASRPGTRVALRLSQGRDAPLSSAADTTVLRDTWWHELDMPATVVAGSVLFIEVTADELVAGQTLLLDDLRVAQIK